MALADCRITKPFRAWLAAIRSTIYPEPIGGSFRRRPGPRSDGMEESELYAQRQPSFAARCSSPRPLNIRHRLISIVTPQCVGQPYTSILANSSRLNWVAYPQSRQWK